MASQAAEEKITVLDNHRGAWTGMSSCGGRKRHEAAPFLGSLCKASDVENKGSQSRLQVGCSPTARSPGNPGNPLTVALGSLSLTSPRVGGLRECHLDSLGWHLKLERTYKSVYHTMICQAENWNPTYSTGGIQLHTWKKELKEEILRNHVNKIVSSGLGAGHFVYHMGSPGFQPRPIQLKEKPTFSCAS